MNLLVKCEQYTKFIEEALADQNTKVRVGPAEAERSPGRAAKTLVTPRVRAPTPLSRRRL